MGVWQRDVPPDVEAMVATIERGETPEYAPASLYHESYESWPVGTFDIRRRVTSRGMWAIVDKTWTARLAAWIAGRRVLEVMAGAGWLAKALDVKVCQAIVKALEGK